MSEVKQVIQAHGVVFCSQGLPVLHGTTKTLKPMVGGGTDGASWKHHVPSDCSWHDLLTIGQKSIALVDEVKLIEATKKTSQVPTHVMYVSLSC